MISNCDTTFKEGLNGPNQIWDFSNINLASNNNVIEYIDPFETPYQADFPLSNLAMHSSSSIDYSYYIVDDSSIKNLGSFFSFEYIPYNIFKVPFTFNDSFSDTIIGVSQGNIVHGKINVVSDGYGKLILPSKSYDNVLRIKKVTNQDVLRLSDQVHTFLNDTVFEWWDSVHSASLFSISYFNSIGGQKSYGKLVTLRDEITGINSISKNRFDLNIYPNPTADLVNISYCLLLPSPVTIEIYNSLSKKVKQINLPSQIYGKHIQPIDKLNSGSYYIKFIVGNIICTQKFVVIK